jgi:chromosome segregation ATPase
VFVPEKYYVAESETPLLQQAFAPLVKRAAASWCSENKWAQRRKAENEYEVGEIMSDQTYFLQRIMGLQAELNYFAESSRQQQIRHNNELSRLQNENRNLQARLGVLQAENNTLRVQLEAGLSAISYLEQRLKFHLKSLVEQESATAAAAWCWLESALLMGSTAMNPSN